MCPETTSKVKKKPKLSLARSSSKFSGSILQTEWSSILAVGNLSLAPSLQYSVTQAIKRNKAETVVLVWKKTGSCLEDTKRNTKQIENNKQNT